MAGASGSTTAGVAPTYGTQGTAATTNSPGSRALPATWIDASGNLWLFGGGCTNSVGYTNACNDLWKFTSATGTWTWISGSSASGSAGSYGTPGVAVASNAPPARKGAQTWIDAAGNLWLFGGLAASSGIPASANLTLGDVWKFSPGTGYWTWVSGGGQGLVSAGVPGGPQPRALAATWMDATGNFWLYGGDFGQQTSAAPLTVSTYALSDLWEYSPGTDTWTLVSGSSGINPTNPVYASYGTQGVPSTANTPGNRIGPSAAVDKSGNVWLFGGSGETPAGLGTFNDLWMFNPTAGTWTWVSGSNQLGQSGVYGTAGVATAGNLPGGRNADAAWIDSASIPTASRTPIATSGPMIQSPACGPGMAVPRPQTRRPPTAVWESRRSPTLPVHGRVAGFGSTPWAISGSTVEMPIQPIRLEPRSTSPTRICSSTRRPDPQIL